MDLRVATSSALGPLGQNPADLARARADNAKAIETVASGFESMFVSLLVKQMRETLEPGSFFGQDNGDVLGGLFDFTMGQHLAQTGALGIGKMVKQQLQARRPS